MQERQIETLEGGKHIRLRWSMYLDAEPATALRLALREAWVNAADELTIRRKTNGRIDIDTRAGWLSVKDNGEGIPVDKLADAFLKPNTGSNFRNRTANLIGANGIGLKAISHTAAEVEVMSRGRFIRIKGGAEEGELVETKDGTTPDGLSIKFKPLKEVYGDATIDEAALFAELDESAKFYPHITFYLNGKKIAYPKGLKLPSTDAYYESENVIISLSCNEGEIKPFGNRLYLPQGGAFMTQFKTQFTRAINDVASLKLTGNQIQAALSGYVAVYVDNPVFSNQQKTGISNKECNTEITLAVAEVVAQLQKSAKWQAVIKRLEMEQKAEEAAERAKAKFLKTQSDFKAKAHVDAKKLVECSSKNRSQCELFICEGDSAAGTIKNARMDAAIQAIFGLRGKILNVNKASFEKMLENKELMMLIKALGGTLTETGIREPAPASRRYGKIIFMNDHDEDGWAIEALLLGFFYKYFPKMIKDGCLYRIAPALFTLTKGDEYKFYADQESAMAASKKMPGKWTLDRHKGWGSMEPEVFAQAATNEKTRQLIQITMGNAALAAKAMELMEIDVAARKDLMRGEFEIGDE